MLALFRHRKQLLAPRQTSQKLFNINTAQQRNYKLPANVMLLRFK